MTDRIFYIQLACFIILFIYVFAVERMQTRPWRVHPKCKGGDTR
jgi:hypothetical protein